MKRPALRGGLDDAVQRLLQVQLPADGEHRFQQAVHPVAGAAGRVDPGLQLLQQLVQPQLRQPYTGLPGLFGASHLRLLRSPGRTDAARSGTAHGIGPPHASRHGKGGGAIGP